MFNRISREVKRRSRRSEKGSPKSKSSKKSKSNKSGKSRNASDPKEELEDQKYYHGLLPRGDIASVLKKNGDFVVRISDDKNVLSVYWNGKPLHYVITKNEKNMYTVDAKLQFESIPELIAYFKTTKSKLGMGAQLIRPVRRQPWELTHDQVNMISKLGEGEWLDFSAFYPIAVA